MEQVFKKVDKIVNGKLCETFYINEKEISQSAYYSLLEDNFSRDMCKSNTDENTLFEKSERYLNEIIDIILTNREAGKRTILEEFQYYYSLGFMSGQLEFTKVHKESIDQNIKILTDNIDNLKNCR